LYNCIAFRSDQKPAKPEKACNHHSGVTLIGKTGTEFVSGEEGKNRKQSVWNVSQWAVVKKVPRNLFEHCLKKRGRKPSMVFCSNEKNRSTWEEG